MSGLTMGSSEPSDLEEMSSLYRRVYSLLHSYYSQHNGDDPLSVSESIRAAIIPSAFELRFSASVYLAELVEALTGQAIPELVSKAVATTDHVSNAKQLLRALELIVGHSLPHISPHEIAAGDVGHISHVLELLLHLANVRGPTRLQTATGGSAFQQPPSPIEHQEDLSAVTDAASSDGGNDVGSSRGGSDRAPARDFRHRLRDDVAFVSSFVDHMERKAYWPPAPAPQWATQADAFEVKRESDDPRRSYRQEQHGVSHQESHTIHDAHKASSLTLQSDKVEHTERKGSASPDVVARVNQTEEYSKRTGGAADPRIEDEKERLECERALSGIAVYNPALESAMATSAAPVPSDDSRKAVESRLFGSSAGGRDSEISAAAAEDPTFSSELDEAPGAHSRTCTAEQAAASTRSGLDTVMPNRHRNLLCQQLSNSRGRLGLSARMANMHLKELQRRSSAVASVHRWRVRMQEAQIAAIEKTPVLHVVPVRRPSDLVSSVVRKVKHAKRNASSQRNKQSKARKQREIAAAVEREHQQQLRSRQEAQDRAEQRKREAIEISHMLRDEQTRAVSIEKDSWSSASNKARNLRSERLDKAVQARLDDSLRRQGAAQLATQDRILQSDREHWIRS